MLKALDVLPECVLIVDEADRILRTEWGAGFFSFLRCIDDTWYGSQISITLVGAPALAQFRDPNDKGSPPLNCANTEYLEPLDLPALAELESMLGKPVNTGSLLSWSGGNAWLATRLLSLMWQGNDFGPACELIYDRGAAQVFPTWQRQAGDQFMELVALIPEDGIDHERLIDGDLTEYRDVALTGRSVGVLRLDNNRLLTGPAPFFRWLRSLPK